MCLISICPKGTEKNTKEVHDFIGNGFISNTDGSGFMYKKDGTNKINVVKGFFDSQEMIDYISKLNLEVNDELVIHHRNGTSGLVSAENCHPFVISKDNNTITDTCIETDNPCIVHNGMIYGITNQMFLNSQFSDTFAFVKYIMAADGVMEMYNNSFSTFELLTDSFLGSDKLCLLHPDRDLTTVGNYLTDNGYLHSNSGYKFNYYDRGGFAHARGNFMDAGKVKKSKKSLLPAHKAENKCIVKKLDSKNVKINSYNCTHFFFCKKEEYETWSFNKASEPLFTFEMRSYDNLSYLQVLYNVKGNIIGRAVSIDSIENNYYYIPKNDKQLKTYSDYLYLIKNYPEYSKSAIKTLQKIISNSSKKSLDPAEINLEDVYFSKAETRFSLEALTMYKEYLEDKKVLKLQFN